MYPLIHAAFFYKPSPLGRDQVGRDITMLLMTLSVPLLCGAYVVHANMLEQKIKIHTATAIAEASCAEASPQ